MGTPHELSGTAYPNPDKPEKCLKCAKMPKIMVSLAQRRRLRRLSLRLYYKRLIFSA